MVDYSNAYAEVYTILNYLNEEELKKIPDRILNVFEKKRNFEYKYEMNDEIDLEKQEMLPETRAILFNLFRDYLATAEQKEKLIKLQQEYIRFDEQSKSLKYSNKDIFENKTNEYYATDLCPIEVQQESIFAKIKNWLKKLFKIKKD